MKVDELRNALEQWRLAGVLPWRGQLMSLSRIENQHTHHAYKAITPEGAYLVKTIRHLPWGAKPGLESMLQRTLGWDKKPPEFWVPSLYLTELEGEVAGLSTLHGIEIRPWIQAQVKTRLNAQEIELAARHLAQLHSVSIKPPNLPVRPLIPYLKNRLQKIKERGLHPETLQTLELMLEKLVPGLEPIDQPIALCHFDPTPGNWLWPDEGGARLIDWEYAAVANPMLDIVCFIEGYDLDPAQNSQFITAYASNINPSKIQWHDWDIQIAVWRDCIALMNQLWELMEAE